MGKFISLKADSQVPLTYILGYEAIRDVNISSAKNMHAAMQRSEDQTATLIAAFKIQIKKIMTGTLKAQDAALWCDELAHFGNNELTRAEYASLSSEIAKLDPRLKSGLTIDGNVDASGKYIVLASKVRIPVKPVTCSSPDQIGL